MVDKLSVLSELSNVSDFEREIFDFVMENWPTTALEIAFNFHEDLSDREKKKRISTKYAYYLKKMVEKKLILCKKAGNTLIVWPLVVEKYRVIHTILKGEHDEHDFLFLSRLKQKSLVGKNA